MKCFSRFLKQRAGSFWCLAFIRESLDQVLKGGSISFEFVVNPYQRECWFADPFILNADNEHIDLLVEEMRYDTPKGRIAKLTIDRRTMTIIRKEVLLEEPWHLSFPSIIRSGEHIYVVPESALGGKLYLYELVQDTTGKDILKRVKTLCDDVVWDSEITNLFGEPYMFTSRTDDYHLDIYQWNVDNERFQFSQSLSSPQKNMRMAGAIFNFGDKWYIPSQISGYTYGEAVEIKELHKSDQGWDLKTIRKLSPPRSILNDGLHTFNTYNNILVVDIHQQNNLWSLLIKKLVILKKRLKNQ